MQELVVQQRQLLRQKRTKRLSVSLSTSECVALLSSGTGSAAGPRAVWVFPPESITSTVVVPV